MGSLLLMVPTETVIWGMVFYHVLPTFHDFIWFPGLSWIIHALSIWLLPRWSFINSFYTILFGGKITGDISGENPRPWIEDPYANWWVAAAPPRAGLDLRPRPSAGHSCINIKVMCIYVYIHIIYIYIYVNVHVHVHIACAHVYLYTCFESVCVLNKPINK